MNKIDRDIEELRKEWIEVDKQIRGLKEKRTKIEDKLIKLHHKKKIQQKV